jgi:hypothetical protein
MFIMYVHGKNITLREKGFQLLATIDPKVREYNALRHLLMTPKGNSYFRAIQLLEQNYGGADRLRQFYLDAIEAFPPLRKDDVDQLQELLELVLEMTLAFESHDILDELASRFFADKLRAKMPEQYSMEYQLWVQNEFKNYNKYLFTYDTIFEFFTRKKDALINDARYRERMRNKKKGIPEPPMPAKPYNRIKAKITYCDLCRHPEICECSPTSATSDVEQIYQEDPDREQVFYTSAVTGRKSFAVPECSLCPGEAHLYRHCRRFLAMTPVQRREHLGKLKKCFRCFRVGHGIKECKSKLKCKTCGGDHHTLICAKTKDTVTAKKNLVNVDSQNNLFALSHQEIQELDMDLTLEDSEQVQQPRLELTEEGARYVAAAASTKKTRRSTQRTSSRQKVVSSAPSPL